MQAIRILAITSLAFGCQRAQPNDDPPPPPKTDQIPLNDHAALLPSVTAGSLTLTPVVATEAGLPKVDLDVMTLDEAFELKQVAIKEKAEESVNNLTLTNKAQRPLFLLAGEVILGGKQDRIIGQNTIIAANTTQVVPVFCVEHGRWDQGPTEFTTGHALAHGRLRARASFGDQGAVWREVAAKNAERKIENSTGTYRQVAQQQSNGTLATGEDAIKAAIARMQPNDRARMIGFVVSLNNKIATIDMFDSPKLFAKLEAKLVRSYLTEAVDTPADKGIKAPSPNDVLAFMADADKAVAQKSYETDEASTVRYIGGSKANKSQVEYKMKSGPMTTKPVYKTYSKKDKSE
jgi:hypothetical protein